MRGVRVTKVWQILPIHLSLVMQRNGNDGVCHSRAQCEKSFDDSCSQECILKSYVYEGKKRVNESIYYFIIICSYFLLVQRNNNTQLRLWTVSDYILRISTLFSHFFSYFFIISRNNPLILLHCRLLSSNFPLSHSLTHSHDNIMRSKEEIKRGIERKSENLLQP